MASFVCRVCLAGDVKMLPIDDFEIFQKFSETKVSYKLITEPNARMPFTVCYICHRMLQRYQQFFDMARTSDRILRDILRNNCEITYNTINYLSLAPVSILSTSQMQIIEFICKSDVTIDPDTIDGKQLVRDEDGNSNITSNAATVNEEQVVEKNEDCNSNITSNAATVNEEQVLEKNEDCNFNITNNDATVNDEQVLGKNEDCNFNITNNDATVNDEQVLGKNEDCNFNITNNNATVNDEQVLGKNEDCNFNITNNDATVNDEQVLWKNEDCNSNITSNDATVNEEQAFGKNEDGNSNITSNAATVNDEHVLGRSEDNEKHLYVIHGNSDITSNPATVNEKQHKMNKDGAITEGIFYSGLQIEPEENTEIIRRINEFNIETIGEVDNSKPNVISFLYNDDCDGNPQLIPYLEINDSKNTLLHPCKWCKKKFICKSFLLKHMQTHVEKSYSCNQCGKMFFQNVDLINHMRTHPDDTVNSCSECGKTVATSCGLKRHMWTHCKNRQYYPCNRCGKKYARQYNLSWHLQAKHGP